MTTVNVGTLRLRTRHGEATALRLRAARGLQAADLMPAGLPPAAVLVLRRLADPMPRRFGLGQLRPPPAWERSVRVALETAAATAARPDERGRIDPEADAVLFEDEAQVLACLTLAHARGGASCWWWRALLGRLHLPANAIAAPDRDPLSILRHRPREAPAALAWVARWGQTGTVAQACSRRSADACVQALGVTFGLAAERLVADDDGGGCGDHQTRAGRSAPWRGFVPPDLARTAVPREVRRLFGVALGVHAGPSRMRASVAASVASRPPAPALSTASHPVLQSLEASWPDEGEAFHGVAAADESATMLATATPHGAGSESGPSVPPAPQAGRVFATDVGDTHAEGVSGSREHFSEDEAQASGTLPPAVRAVDESALLPQTSRQAGGAMLSEPHRVPMPRTRARSTSPPRRRHVSPTWPAHPLSSVLATEGVATRLGGVFYLIHALRALQLPDTFGPRWQLDATAGPWGTLDLIARALLGSRCEADDPLWPALAALAAWPKRHHRPRATAASLSPASAMNDPRFTVPAAWRGELDDSGDRFAWASIGARLWLWSSAGYLVSHGRTSGQPEAAARQTVRQRAGISAIASIRRRPSAAIPWLPPAALPSGCPPHLGRWAAAVAPAVLRRVLLAVGDRGAGRRSSARAVAGAIRPVLAVPARLYITSSHVDVVIPIGRIDVNVRRAGLDRDPGWIPAVGRVVYFHFA